MGILGSSEMTILPLVFVHVCLNQINGKRDVDDVQKWWNFGSSSTRVYMHCVIFDNPSIKHLDTVLLYSCFYLIKLLGKYLQYEIYSKNWTKISGHSVYCIYLTGKVWDPACRVKMVIWKWQTFTRLNK